MGIIDELKDNFVKETTESIKQNIENMNETDNIVVFLDLLGFSECVKTKGNFQAAVSKMENYNTIVGIQFTEQIIHPVGNYPDQIKELAESSYLTTFDYFLPASDSVFIATKKENLNVFVKQLCSFLYKSYSITANKYADPEDETEATLQKGWTFKVGGKTIKTDDIYYSPCLFRGGMAIGECKPLEQVRVVNGQLKNDNCNLVGKAVVEAVHMEKLVNGPRVVVTQSFYSQCDLDIQKHYFRKVEDIKEKYKEEIEEDIYELLWPASAFIRDNGIQLEVKILDEFVEGAYNLYKSESNKGAEKHYIAFIELLYNTILTFWDNETKAQDVVRKYRKQYTFDKK